MLRLQTHTLTEVLIEFESNQGFGSVRTKEYRVKYNLVRAEWTKSTRILEECFWSIQVPGFKPHLIAITWENLKGQESSTSIMYNNIFFYEIRSDK